MIVALLFSATLLADQAAAGSAVSEPPVPAPAAAAPPTKKKTVDPDRVCRIEAPMGSKVPVKSCYSRDVMAQRTSDDKANLERIQMTTFMKSHE